VLLSHLSAGMQPSHTALLRRAIPCDATRVRCLTHFKNISFNIIGFLIWIVLFVLSDPAFLHCNRWTHQQSCASHATQRDVTMNSGPFR